MSQDQVEGINYTITKGQVMTPIGSNSFTNLRGTSCPWAREGKIDLGVPRPCVSPKDN